MTMISEENFNSSKFHLLIANFEGPIDLLLFLARNQKVDLSQISITELAEQYINFINQYKNIHIEIAADYLVMAAWLTYLKSRLLLPKTLFLFPCAISSSAFCNTSKASFADCLAQDGNMGSSSFFEPIFRRNGLILLFL